VGDGATAVEVARGILQQPRSGRAGRPSCATTARIDFNWGSGSPGGGIGPDFFAVRWANAFRLDGGKYRFTVEVDDGARLWVDDRLVIDEWREQALRKFTQELELGAGNHTFRLEYVEYTGVRPGFG
jgi:hypothetical protein